MKRILTLIITATFSLCSIVSSEEETTDSNPTPTLPKSDEGKPEREAKSPDLINPSININAWYSGFWQIFICFEVEILAQGNYFVMLMGFLLLTLCK